VFDGKEFGTPVPYCGGELWAIAGNAQSSDALSGLQQLTLSTSGFAFGGTNNALSFNGVTAAQVLADVVRIESGLVRSAPASVNMFAATTPSMNEPRAGATATLLPNGKVLITGGAGTSTELYDPVTDTFAASTPSMNTARGGATATLLPNGKVLIAGGSGEAGTLASTELYNPVTNKFAPEASTPVMNVAREYATATLLANGKVLIVGGVTIFGTDAGSLGSTELYDANSNTFAASTPSTDGTIFATATLLANGKPLIAGGVSIIPFSPVGTVQKSTELYTP
jgi:hypothetical protein